MHDRSAQFIIDHVKNNPRDAETMEEMVREDQLRLVRGEVQEVVDRLLNNNFNCDAGEKPGNVNQDDDNDATRIVNI